MSVRALQVPEWQSPISSVPLINVFLVVEKFMIDLPASRYEVVAAIYVNEEAYTSGRQPVAKLYYANDDGIFPNWAASLTDPAFRTPLETLRDWGFTVMKTLDPRLAGAVDVTG